MAGIIKKDLLEAVVRVAERLSQAAVWDHASARCNWMGSAISGDESLQRVVALGPDLYAGSGGIALALGECFPFTGVLRHKLTAQAALTRSISILQGENAQLFGFYGGEAGIGYVARRLATIGVIDDPSGFIDGICEKLSKDFEKPLLLDITGGVGGTILFLVSEYTRNPAGNLANLIERYATYLCDRAVWQGSKCAWVAEEATGLKFSTPLGGYSHGTAGIASALFEAFAVTGSRRLLDAARAATAYDESLFDPEACNWRDVRFENNSSGASSGSFPVAWCHGAAGIALARVRAAQIDCDQAEKYRASILIGVETTASFLRTVLNKPAHDCTLCHGIAGLVDVIRVASDYLGDTKRLDVCEEAIQRLAAIINRTGICVSGLLDGRPHPSLMLGDAGIAFQLLREISDWKIPSILFV